jgi:molybdopterin-guanine dinucleotide biosynthesis protein A
LNAVRAYSLGILAGGQGARWGGRDKGLIAHQGRPLIAGIVAPRPQSAGEVLICCRDHPYFYQHFADRVMCEAVANQGPCAGITALLSAAAYPTALILPVDLIGAPEQVVAALTACQAFLDEGGRKITGLLEAVGARPISVDAAWLHDADLPASISP